MVIAEGRIRRLSREISMSSSRIEGYHVEATAAAVPFVWESRPGTPKHTSFSPQDHTFTLPPLTPPPSYQSYTPNYNRPFPNKHSNPNLFHSIFRRLAVKKHTRPSSPASSSSSSSSSSLSSSSAATTARSVPSSPAKTWVVQRRDRWSQRVSLHASTEGAEQEEEEEEYCGSPVSTTLCFSLRGATCRGCYSTSLKVLQGGDLS